MHTVVPFGQKLHLQVVFLGSANLIDGNAFSELWEDALDCHGSGPMFVSTQELKINAAATAEKRQTSYAPPKILSLTRTILGIKLEDLNETAVYGLKMGAINQSFVTIFMNAV